MSAFLRANRAGGAQKKLPNYVNDLPHYGLVLCSKWPNDHGHLYEV